MLGMGAAGVIIPSCIGGCSKDDDDNYRPTTVDFDIDLTSADNVVLTADGGFKSFSDKGVIVLNKGGNYYAVSSICPHEQKTLTYDVSSQRINCTNHRDQYFSITGVSEKQQTNDNLKVYT